MKWIRRLFAPSRPSPAIERFLGWLAETPYHWHVASNSKIRAREQGVEMCAITGVVRYRLGAIFSIGDWVRAADTIGLSYTEAGLIVEAADAAGPPGARMMPLRERLRVATRIESSSAIAKRPDAIECARADLFPVSSGTEDLGRLLTEQHAHKEEELIPA